VEEEDSSAAATSGGLHQPRRRVAHADLVDADVVLRGRGPGAPALRLGREPSGRHDEMSRRNKAPTLVAEATDAVRFRRPKPPNPVPERMIEIV
jgi:hypothetical protein